ncbi:MAG: MFS transporter [Pseudomonadales bacterium]|jgi:MFS family permease|nr:MFS transporter [Pseudomonadales bacterium]
MNEETNMQPEHSPQPASAAPEAATDAGKASSFTLLRERRFAPLFVTQFLGAFNDNAYKNVLIVLFSFNAAAWTTLPVAVLVNLVLGLLMLPFFLFSATAGQLADKFDKARLARWVKALEILIIVIAALGFWLHNLFVLLGSLLLLGLHSTLFGPIKYAILPQHLRATELVAGNALVEAGTFVAILLGTLSGGLLAGVEHGALWVMGLCLLMACVGFYTSCHIPTAPAPVPELKIAFNPLRETWRCIGLARQERSVFLSILALSWFWLYGATLLTQVPIYTRTVLGGDESSVTLLLAVFCVGIGAGSLLCDKLTHRRGKLVEPGLVPLGALGMLIFGIDLAFATPTPTLGENLPLSVLLSHGSTWRILLDLVLLSGSGGLYCVPLYALIQQRSDANCRARIIAANNIFNALFMVLGALAAAAFLGSRHGSIPALFLWIAAVHAGITVYVFSVIPEFLLRALIWLGLRKQQ